MCLSRRSYPLTRVGLATVPPNPSPTLVTAPAVAAIWPRPSGSRRRQPLAFPTAVDAPLVLANDMIVRADALSTGYLDSGAQLTVVLDAACLDNVTVAPAGHYLKGAVEGSQMTITAYGSFRIAEEITVPAVVCPTAAANLVGMLPILNASPNVSLTIGAATAGKHKCTIRDGQKKIMELSELQNLLPFALSNATAIVHTPPAAPVQPAVPVQPDLDDAQSPDHPDHALLCALIDEHLDVAAFLAAGNFV